MVSNEYLRVVAQQVLVLRCHWHNAWFVAKQALITIVEHGAHWNRTSIPDRASRSHAGLFKGHYDVPEGLMLMVRERLLRPKHCRRRDLSSIVSLAVRK